MDGKEKNGWLSRINIRIWRSKNILYIWKLIWREGVLELKEMFEYDEGLNFEER